MKKSKKLFYTFVLTLCCSIFLVQVKSSSYAEEVDLNDLSQGWEITEFESNIPGLDPEKIFVPLISQDQQEYGLRVNVGNPGKSSATAERKIPVKAGKTYHIKLYYGIAAKLGTRPGPIVGSIDFNGNTISKTDTDPALQDEIYEENYTAPSDGFYTITMHWECPVGSNIYLKVSAPFKDNFDWGVREYGQPVTIHYLDDQNNKLQDDVITSGMVGEGYQIEQPTFDGYTFTTIEGQTDNLISDQPQELTVRYTKIKTPIKGADVTVNYIDTSGKEISNPIVLDGNIGEHYTATQLVIEGYTFKEVKGSTTGTFTNQTQSVTYIYTKNDDSNLAIPEKPATPDKELSQNKLTTQSGAKLAEVVQQKLPTTDEAKTNLVTVGAIFILASMLLLLNKMRLEK